MMGLYVTVSGSHTYIIKERKKKHLQLDFSLIGERMAQKMCKKASYVGLKSTITKATTSSGHHDIQAGAVINGTVVAQGKIEFKGDNVTMTATPSSYPALLCQDNLDGGNQSSVYVIGLIYSNNHFDKDGTNFHRGSCWYFSARCAPFKHQFSGDL